MGAEGLATLCLDGLQGEVSACGEGGCRAGVVLCLGGGEVEVAPGLYDEAGGSGGGVAVVAPDGEGGDAVKVGAGGAGAACLGCGVLGGALDVDVLACLEGQAVVGADGAAEVVDVGLGGQYGIGSLDVATVVKVVGVEVQGGVRSEGAAVMEFTAEGELDAVAGDQGAVALEVACACFDVELWHEGLGGAAVRQADGLLDEPDDVAGELGDLVCGQRNSWRELEGLRNCDAVVDQCAVLVVVVLESLS